VVGGTNVRAKMNCDTMPATSFARRV